MNNGHDVMRPVFDYLATPYTHNDPEVREARACIALAYVEAFFGVGRWMFSPIAYLHQIALLGRLPESSEPYRAFNFAMLASARRLVVVRMCGWLTSQGVAEEIAEAKRIGKTIEFIDHVADVDDRARHIAALRGLDFMASITTNGGSAA